MALNIKNVTVDGRNYTLTMFSATKALKLNTKLLKLLGGPLGKIVDGFKGAPKDLMNARVELGSTIQLLAENLDSSEGQALMSQLLEGIKFDETGDEVSRIFDTHFQGKIGSMYVLLYEQIRFQFEDFFGVVTKALNSVQA